jgi:uncharacterized RDD family membrane protein YckC
METPGGPESPSAALVATVSYAGFWRRYWAALFDGVFLGIGFWVLFFSWSLIYSVLAGEPMSFSLGRAYVIQLVAYLSLGWIYFAGMESSAAQATPGKIAMGIAVTDLTGDRLFFGRATARFFAKNLSAALLLIGFVIAGFTEKKQALHDLLTDSLVVRKHNPNERVFWNLGLLTVLGVVLLMVVVRVEQARQEQQAKEAEAQRLEEARQENLRRERVERWQEQERQRQEQERQRQEQERQQQQQERQQQDEEARKQALAREAEVKTLERKAERVVRESHLLDPGRTTSEVVEGWVSRLPDVEQIRGWRTELAHSPSDKAWTEMNARSPATATYLVTYAFVRSSGGEERYDFDVNLKTEEMRSVTGNRALAARYGLAPSEVVPSDRPVETEQAARMSAYMACRDAVSRSTGGGRVGSTDVTSFFGSLGPTGYRLDGVVDIPQRNQSMVHKRYHCEAAPEWAEKGSRGFIRASPNWRIRHLTIQN